MSLSNTPPGSCAAQASTSASLHLAEDDSRHSSSLVSTSAATQQQSARLHAHYADTAPRPEAANGLALGLKQPIAAAGQQGGHDHGTLPQGVSASQPDVGLPQDALGLLQYFMDVHHNRARHYARLHLGFRRFLENKQEGQYRSLLADLTPALSHCSLQKVRAVQAELQGRGQQELASLLDSIQAQECNKLRLTLSLQALKQAGAAGAFSWQKLAAPEGVGPLGGLDVQEDDPLEPHAAHHHHHQHPGDHKGHACCEAPPPEPTAKEYNNALQESIQHLDRCVTAINNLIEEIMYAIEDLKEE